MVSNTLCTNYLMYLFVICSISLSKKLDIPDMNSVTNIDRCRRCKVLTDSFNTWMEKTSRGKYEGGDAAWEEAKLKIYARSEVRLVEIQEALCSEVKTYQDHCYTLAEEAEQPLEKWWFSEDPNSIDLYSWLCIETLLHCCPQNHYGELCSPCPHTTDNQICSGHGKCDGDGTRRGNGTCICKNGYTGKYCEECAKNFYSINKTCQSCHRACNGCTGKDAGSCIACKKGWQLEAGSCVDINECSYPSTCKDNQFCVNREGSFICEQCDESCKSCIGTGSSNCTSCKVNYSLWSGLCVDEKLKNELVTNALKHVALYSGLLTIALFIFRHSKMLASFTVLIVAMYISISEKTTKINVFDVFLNICF